MDYRRGLQVLEPYLLSVSEESRQRFNLYKTQLLENLYDEERYGPTRDTRHWRLRIIDQLNPFAEQLTGASFTDLCLEMEPTLPIDVVDSSDDSTAGALVLHTQLGQLWNNLNGRINRQELRTICFDLGIDSDNLRGETKSDQLRDLLVHLARRNDLQRLGSWIQSHRPDIAM